MTVARTWGVALQGTMGSLVEIEADLTQQLPEFRLIGLADKALGEAQLRVRNATENCGMPLPSRRLTVNLSPASLPKHGAGFDVGIAVASLATAGGFDLASLAETAHVGELGLDGRVRPVPGVLPAVLAARRGGIARVVVPSANRQEAELVGDVRVHGVESLIDVARLHGAEVEDRHFAPHESRQADEPDPPPYDLADVMGQNDAVEALIVAAAGGHHLMMSGPPGAGKTMLAQRLPGIIPPLSREEALEIAAVRSLCGESITRLDTRPPFESPHHTASVAALVGGGSRMIRPGAVARATNGILYLDEAAEYPRHVLDALRQPLESGTITIHRADASATFPARFQLVIATNPCPCGQFGVVGGLCQCPPATVRRYIGRLSGPLLDRVDLELHLVRVTSVDDSVTARTTSATARERVALARERAEHRLTETPWNRNAQVPGSWLRRGPHALDAATREPIDRALRRGALTLRGYDRVLRVAWTIADLAGRENPTPADIGRALYFKKGIAS